MAKTTAICLIKEKKKEEFSTFLISSTKISNNFFLSPYLSSITGLNWININVLHVPLFHTWKHFLCSCVFKVHMQANTGPPTFAVESQVLLSHLNEIHFDVTFEGITSHGGALKRLANSSAIGWSPPKPTCPLVTDTAFNPEPPPPQTFHTHSHFTYPSSVFLSVSPGRSAVLFSSYCTKLSAFPDTSWFRPNGVVCHFKAPSDSLHGVCSASLEWSHVQRRLDSFRFLSFLSSARVIFEGEFYGAL